MSEIWYTLAISTFACCLSYIWNPLNSRCSYYPILVYESETVISSISHINTLENFVLN